MKLVGSISGIQVYSDPSIEDGLLYLVNDNNFDFNYPTKKNGKPDMRYSINKMMKIFNRNHPDKIFIRRNKL